MQIIRSAFQIRYWFVAFGGALVALVAWKLMNMEHRYALAITGGIVFVCVVMMGISRITDILLYAMVFNIPFSMFGKWFGALEEPITGVAAHGISLGMAELLIVLAYTVWFAWIFIARKEPLPKLHKIDGIILLLLFVQAISWLGAHDKRLAAYDIIYNIKHILIYFFIAHKVERRHLKWIVIILLFAIMLQSSTGLYERVTGHTGLGFTKGNIEKTKTRSQLKVLGLEEIRATGTASTSHGLGLYYCLLLPVPFVLMMTRYLRPMFRVILAFTLIVGIMGLIMTFTRSGWLSFAIAATFATGVIIILWKQGTAFFIALAIFAIVSGIYPKAYGHLYNRLFKAPSQLLESRYVLNRTALSVWRQHVFFGAGPANYHNAIRESNVRIYGHGVYPVHNSYLIIASETGLFGLMAFWGIIVHAMICCWKLLKCNDPLIRGLALAIMAAFFAYALDGLTGPMFKQAVPYAQLWLYIGLCISFRRILRKQIPSYASKFG